MNAVDERFNRTIQEEFVAHNEAILVKDLALFNEVLFEYLGRYNLRRPHQGLAYKTPAQQLAFFALICPICHGIVHSHMFVVIYGKIRELYT